MPAVPSPRAAAGDGDREALARPRNREYPRALLEGRGSGSFLIYLSMLGSGKSRINTVVNASSSYICMVNGSQIIYNGANSAGASVKYCCIEKISCIDIESGILDK